MKRKFIDRPFYLVLFLLAILWMGCREAKKDQAHTDPAKVEIDSSLKNLIVPTDQQVVSSIAGLKPSYGPKIVTEELQGKVDYDNRQQQNLSSRVSGRIEKLYVKYNFQSVKKGQLIMEIYSPELAAAQQELIYLLQQDASSPMVASLKQRLSLLGMGTGSIDDVIRTKRVNYRIPVYSPVSGFIMEESRATSANANEMSGTSTSTSGGGMEGMGGSGGGELVASTPTSTAPQTLIIREGEYVNAGKSLFIVYTSDQLIGTFTLKPESASNIKQGDRLAYYTIGDKKTIRNGEVGLIEPVFGEGAKFTTLRVYLRGTNFRIGSLLTARVPIYLNASWWLPESAVYSLGRTSVVFKKQGGAWVPTTVKTGVKSGDQVQILQDISTWEVAKHASYLIDSESFLKVKK